jgi:predicted Zn-dependent protease
MRRDQIISLAESLIRTSPADETEVFFREHDDRLTRFANNAIHQNVAVTNAEALIRVAFGRKVGVASANTLSAAPRALEQACEIARNSSESADFVGLPKPAEVKPVNAFDEAVAACSAAERAARVKNVVEEAKKAGAVAAGAFSVASGGFAVVNSHGVAAYHPITEANLNVVMMKDGGSATARRVGWRLADVDEREAARFCSSRAQAALNPQDVEPGEYTVVLEPEAVGILVKFLAYTGFNGKAYHEKSSFMAGRMGLRVTGPLITIFDDGLDPAGIPLPFDFEGVPKKRVTFIEKGIAKGMCFDTAIAAKEKTESTGHALPAGESRGPFPLNLFMAPGESSLDEMIASTKKGLLVANFHYANVVERMKTVITGMTRFGLFLIRDGKIAYPVKNLRFTQSILEAFETADALTRDRRAVGNGVMAVVPGMRCESFRFSGKTEF